MLLIVNFRARILFNIDLILEALLIRACELFVSIMEITFGWPDLKAG